MFRVARLAVACVLLSPGSLLAVSLTVNSTIDDVDVNPGDGVCANSAGPAAVCTLRAAIQEANALPGDDTITIPAGVYTLAIPGTAEDSAATGDLDINDLSAGALTLNGAGPAATIIDGGGIDRVFNTLSDAIISGVTIQNGHAVGDSGGGLYNNSNGAAGSLTLSNVVIASNAADVNGGGIQNDNGTITFNDVTIRDNTTAGSGGGLNNIDTMILNGATISGNMANGGGGINNDGLSVTLTNVTVSGNMATLRGGGVQDNVGATLTNVTISGNVAHLAGASGGNFYYVGDEMFTNVIVANSIAGDDCAGFGALTSGGHNLDGANTCGFTGPGDLINTDPRLGPLADNGGPTFTEALLSDSPAIDAGAGCPATDQRGLPRVDGNGDGIVACDIGAFEFQPNAVTTTTTTTATTTSTSTTTTLPSCSPGATFGSIACRLGTLSDAVATSVPPGVLRDGLEKSVMKAMRLTGQAENAPVRKGKRLLGMAAGSLGKVKARLHTAKAQRTIGSAVDGLKQMAGQLQSDVRTLRGSL